MASKLFLALIFFGSFSCGKTTQTPDPGTNRIGDPLEKISPLYTNGDKSSVDASYAFVSDEPSRRVLKVNLTNFSIENAYPFSDDEAEHFLLGGTDGKFVIDFSAKTVSSIKENGERVVPNVSFTGKPQNASFNDSLGILAVQDSLRSIGLFVLSQAGDFKKSWIGGPLISDGQYTASGQIDKKGNLLLAANDNSFIKADVSGSIDQGSWKTETFKTDLTEINWIAADSAGDQIAIVTSKDALALIDYSAKTVLKKITLSSGALAIISRSRRVKPHVLLTNVQNSKYYLYYFNGTNDFTVKEMTDISSVYLAGFSDSIMEPDASTITLKDTKAAYQVRLSDLLVLSMRTLPVNREIFVGPRSFIARANSSLGLMQLINFKNSDIKELQGFNRDHFRD